MVFFQVANVLLCFILHENNAMAPRSFHLKSTVKVTELDHSCFNIWTTKVYSQSCSPL